MAAVTNLDALTTRFGLTRNGRFHALHCMWTQLNQLNRAPEASTLNIAQANISLDILPHRSFWSTYLHAHANYLGPFFLDFLRLSAGVLMSGDLRFFLFTRCRRFVGFQAPRLGQS